MFWSFEYEHTRNVSIPKRLRFLPYGACHEIVWLWCQGLNIDPVFKIAFCASNNQFQSFQVIRSENRLVSTPVIFASTFIRRTVDLLNCDGITNRTSTQTESEKSQSWYSEPKPASPLAKNLNLKHCNCLNQDVHAERKTHQFPD